MVSAVPFRLRSCLLCRLLLGSGVSSRIGPDCCCFCQVAGCPGGLGLSRLALVITLNWPIPMVGHPNLASSVSILTRRLVFLAKALFGFGSSLSVYWTFTLPLLRSSIWFCPVTSSLFLSPTLLDPLGAPGLSRCLSALAMEVWNPGIGEIIVELQTEQICF